MTEDKIRDEALNGPWESVLTDNSGWEINPEYLDDYEPDDVRISIVRGTAAPAASGPVGARRLPGTYNSDDHLIEFDDFEDLDEVRARWVQAQAMAAGLNAAVGVAR